MIVVVVVVVAEWMATNQQITLGAGIQPDQMRRLEVK